MFKLEITDFLIFLVLLQTEDMAITLMTMETVTKLEYNSIPWNICD